MDATTGLRKYLTRLGQSHPKIFARVLAKRELVDLGDLPDDDLFAFAEELRGSAGLKTGFMLARARGVSLLDDPGNENVQDGDEPRATGTTGFQINAMALKLYQQDDTASLKDAVDPGATVSDQINQMGVAANAIRKAEAK